MATTKKTSTKSSKKVTTKTTTKSSSSKTSNKSSSTSSSYYKKYTGKSSSIVAALNAIGVNSSKTNRTKIATANGIKNYTGTASQNTKLLNLLKNGKLKKTTSSSSSSSKKTSTKKKNTSKTTKTKTTSKKKSTTITDTSAVKGKGISNLTMNLFGIPYQFPKAVDPRINTVSDTIGKKFHDVIMTSAPVITIIPGNPDFLAKSNASKKQTTARALLEGAAGDFSNVTKFFKSTSSKDIRMYDFKSAYTEYMNYVNVMCRAGATFLELKETSAGMGSSKSDKFQEFDWKRYRWNKKAQDSMIKRSASSLGSALKFIMESSDSSKDSGNLKEVFKNYNYVQFYIDPDEQPSESISNGTGDSSFKGLLDTGSSMFREAKFWMNSGGMDTSKMSSFVEGTRDSLMKGIDEAVGGISSTLSGVLSRIVDFSSGAIKGEGFLIPDVYTGSSYSKTYSTTIHLKTPYGDKFSWYLNIFVPLMHLLALVIPRQASANSYGSPFLVKAYVDGIFSCNMGIVTDMSITKSPTSWSANGLPNEVDVSFTITDLYSDLMMSPSNKPMQFIHNTSMIEYLATQCGMDLTAPNLSAKVSNIINVTKNSIKDIPTNIASTIDEKISNAISKVTSLM